MAKHFALHLDESVVEGELAAQVLHEVNGLKKLASEPTLLRAFLLTNELHDGDDRLRCLIGDQVVVNLHELE